MNLIQSCKTSPALRGATSLLLMVITGIISIWNDPVMILVIFYIYQIWVRMLNSNSDENSHITYTEHLFVGPAKVVVALLMLVFPFSEDGYTNLVWLGIAFWFFCSGVRSCRISKIPFFKFFNLKTESAKQKQQRERIEQSLFTDLSSFLGNSDLNKK